MVKLCDITHITNFKNQKIKETQTRRDDLILREKVAFFTVHNLYYSAKKCSTAEPKKASSDVNPGHKKTPNRKNGRGLDSNVGPGGIEPPTHGFSVRIFYVKQCNFKLLHVSHSIAYQQDISYFK
jgi:hypothetical protein